MVRLVACVGFIASWCAACDRVVDRLDCGHTVAIQPEDVGEAAPGRCPTCGWSRMHLRPNGAGEGAMRAAALGMVRERRRSA